MLGRFLSKSNDRGRQAEREGRVRLHLHLTADRWLDVAAMIDLFSSRMIGWSMSATLPEQFHLAGMYLSQCPPNRQRATARILKQRRMAVLLEASDWFVGRQVDLMGYVSFASNDPRFKLESYRGLTFAPGALAETAVSTSGRTFHSALGGLSLVADLVAQGVTGAKGYIAEPLSIAIASPSIIFERYTRGWTLAESYYAASALVGWTDIILGDPIARAYPIFDCAISTERGVGSNEETPRNQ